MSGIRPGRAAAPSVNDWFWGLQQADSAPDSHGRWTEPEAPFPYGPDLDNYLKRFQDALHKTIFADVPGGDSCIVSLEVSKIRIESQDLAGAQLEVIPHSHG